ncbi:MAG: hypothetical protein ABIH11_07660 [Candidatus Altiarchaeota archaeon]
MGTTTVTASGFAKIKPQLAGTGLASGGTFTGVFTNGVGTTINIDLASSVINETSTSAACATPTLSAGTNPISAGDNFALTATGCGTGNTGDVYSLDVSIAYNVTIGTVVTDHTESGSIRGPRE